MMELPNGWKWTRLADVAEVRLGRQRSPKRATGDRMRPYLRAANVTWNGLDLSDVKEMEFTVDESVTYELQPGDLLLSEASGSPGEVGKPAQYSGEIEGCCFQNTLLRVRLPDGLVPDFFEYFFSEQALNGRFAAGSRGVGIRHLGAAALSDWRVPVPPAFEQERIVAAIEEAFSKLDAGEAGLRTVRQLLKRMREAVLAAAVTGRLVPQDPTDTAAAEFLADLGVEPAAHGAEFPPGWASVQLGDLATTISGPAFKSSHFGGPGDGIRLLRGENIEPGSLRWRDTRTWPTDLLDGYEYLLVEATDIILAMDRPVISTGLKLARVRPDDLPVLLVQRVARIRPVRDDLGPYLWLVMQDRRFIAHLLGGQVGTQLPHITLRAIRDYELAVPGPDEMARVLAEADRQISVIEACERAVDAGLGGAVATRRSVLKAAFEGRLVPQDPSDEPASVLLERILKERAAVPKAARRSRRTA